MEIDIGQDKGQRVACVSQSPGDRVSLEYGCSIGWAHVLITMGCHECAQPSKEEVSMNHLESTSTVAGE